LGNDVAASQGQPVESDATSAGSTGPGREVVVPARPASLVSSAQAKPGTKAKSQRNGMQKGRETATPDERTASARETRKQAARSSSPSRTKMQTPTPAPAPRGIKVEMLDWTGPAWEQRGSGSGVLLTKLLLIWLLVRAWHLLSVFVGIWIFPWCRAAGTRNLDPGCGCV
jgi:hypothetical protein